MSTYVEVVDVVGVVEVDVLVELEVVDVVGVVDVLKRMSMVN